MKTIVSEANETVKYLRKLCEKKHRDREGMFLIEGIHLLYEVLRSGAELRQIYVRAGDEGLPEIRELLQSVYARDEAASTVESTDEDGSPEYKETSRARLIIRRTPVVLIGRDLFDGIADTVTPQGVMAAVKTPQPRARGFGSAVVLDRLQDPGNVGSIIRSADAAGIEAVICVRGTADVYSSKVLRAAAGAVFRRKIYFAEDADDALRMLRENGIAAIACDMKGEMPYHAAALEGSVGFIIGNEGGGLSEAFITGCDERVYIPMEADSESLNASVAAAIVMFERRRQGLSKQANP